MEEALEAWVESTLIPTMLEIASPTIQELPTRRITKAKEASAHPEAVFEEMQLVELAPEAPISNYLRFLTKWRWEV